MFDTKAANDYKTHFHLSPTDLIPMAWELLPWSWLFDYFFTAGAYLDDVFQSDRTPTLYCIENKRVTRNYYGNTTDISVAPGWVLDSFYASPRFLESGCFTRTPRAAIPGRIFRFKTSNEVDNHLLNKLLNLTSILVSGRSRR